MEETLARIQDISSDSPARSAHGLPDTGASASSTLWRDMAVVEIFGGVEVIHSLTWPRRAPWEAAGGVESMK